MTARGSISTMEPTSDTIRVPGRLGDIAEHDRSVYRFGKDRLEKCKKAIELSIEAMHG